MRKRTAKSGDRHGGRSYFGIRIIRLQKHMACTAVKTSYHIHAPRGLVAAIMKEIDPNGVEERKAQRLRRRTFHSRGANATWHMDGRYIEYFMY